LSRPASGAPDNSHYRRLLDSSCNARLYSAAKRSAALFLPLASPNDLVGRCAAAVEPAWRANCWLVVRAKATTPGFQDRLSRGAAALGRCRCILQPAQSIEDRFHFTPRLFIGVAFRWLLPVPRLQRAPRYLRSRSPWRHG